jgi:protein-arginine kinase activator protein McsA
MICQVCHEGEARFERGRGSHRIQLCLHCFTRSGLQHLDDWRLRPVSGRGESGGPRCPGCGLDGHGFSLRGRFGCPDCRDTFASCLGPLLVPPARRHAAEAWPLEVDLSLALLLEDYELAARLRDRLEDKES